jgi:signal transduction histidine kinase
VAASLTHATTLPLPPTSDDRDFAAAVEAAKLQALYNLAYGLSHEINNPLANIATRAQTLLIDEKDPERRRKLATINQQAFRAHEMIADLMLFARPPAMAPEPTDVAALADRVVAELLPQAREQGTTLVRLGAKEPLMTNVDPTQIAVALRALVANSLEALRTGGRVEVSAELGTRNAELVPSTQFLVPSTHPIPAPHYLPAESSSSYPRSEFHAPSFLLTVRDTGPGIPAGIRPHIFDPFFSGREAGRGLGLGLSKAWRIVQLHGGTLTVESPASGGAIFAIALPQIDGNEN